MLPQFVHLHHRVFNVFNIISLKCYLLCTNVDPYFKTLTNLLELFFIKLLINDTLLKPSLNFLNSQSLTSFFFNFQLIFLPFHLSFFLCLWMFWNRLRILLRIWFWVYACAVFFNFFSFSLQSFECVKFFLIIKFYCQLDLFCSLWEFSKYCLQNLSFYFEKVCRVHFGKSFKIFINFYILKKSLIFRCKVC